MKIIKRLTLLLALLPLSACFELSPNGAKSLAQSKFLCPFDAAKPYKIGIWDGKQFAYSGEFRILTGDMGKKCELREANKLTPDASDAIMKMIEQNYALVGNGIYLAYGDKNPTLGQEAAYIKRYNEGTIKVWLDCGNPLSKKPNLKAQNAIKDAAISSIGEKCRLDTVTQIYAIANKIDDFTPAILIKPAL